AAHEHRAAGARSRASGTAARETPAQTRAQQRTDVRAAVDVRLELDALSIPRAADADAGIRHETAVRPLEDEIREDVRRHHRELDRVRNLAAVGRAPETGVLAKSDPRADLEPIPQPITARDRERRIAIIAVERVVVVEVG